MPAVMKTTRTHARASDKAQISVSMPRELLALIDAAAKKEKRNRSNWLQFHLEELAKQPAKSTAATLRIIKQDQANAS